MMRHTPLESMLSVVVSQVFTENICLSGGADFSSCICSIYPCVFGLDYGKYLIKS